MTTEQLGLALAAFVINLPIAVMRDSPEKVWPKRPDESQLGSTNDTLDGLRVLVVDDEPDARTLVRRVLAESGALVALAASAKEAMEQLWAFRPYVLVSDVGMPEERGYDLLRQVRAELSASQLPPAALTAFARAEDRKRVLRRSLSWPSPAMLRIDCRNPRRSTATLQSP